MRTILRPADVYGRGNPIPVGRTKFYQDYVEHDEADPYLPGTIIPRLKAVPLGDRAIGFLGDKIAELQEALIRIRNNPSSKPGRYYSAQGGAADTQQWLDRTQTDTQSLEGSSHLI